MCFIEIQGVFQAEWSFDSFHLQENELSPFYRNDQTESKHVQYQASLCNAPQDD